MRESNHYNDIGTQEVIHYYLEGERVIFTPLFLSQRGNCCGNQCRHCPFDPKHKRGTIVLSEKFGHLKESS